jgi:NAD(P)-dependent dehydrogenase (short-subunit alcohol dehydrogenase family)
MGTWNCATAAARMFLKLNTKGSIVMTASMASYGANKVRLVVYEKPPPPPVLRRERGVVC